jgi:hypothetical protein
MKLGTKKDVHIVRRALSNYFTATGLGYFFKKMLYFD